MADGVNVGYDVYRIKTKITEGGSKVEAGYYIDKRSKLTRKQNGSFSTKISSMRAASWIGT